MQVGLVQLWARITVAATQWSKPAFWYIQAIGLAGPWPFPMARQPRMAAVTKSLATATLSLTVLFCAKLAAIAEAKIQPEP
jgi:hypothetical protein